MALNIDCFKDLLIFFNEVDDETSTIHYQAIGLDQYNEEDILDCCLLLTEAEYIDGMVEKYIDGNIDYYFRNMTNDGKAFLQLISDEDKWHHFKRTIKPFSQPSGIVIKMIAYAL